MTDQVPTARFCALTFEPYGQAGKFALSQVTEVNADLPCPLLWLPLSFTVCSSEQIDHWDLVCERVQTQSLPSP